MGVTSWYRSLGLSELEEHSCESSLKLRKRFSNGFQNTKGGYMVYDQSEPVSRP